MAVPPVAAPSVPPKSVAPATMTMHEMVVAVGEVHSMAVAVAVPMTMAVTMAVAFNKGKRPRSLLFNPSYSAGGACARIGSLSV